MYKKISSILKLTGVLL